jgi:photosystem II stability/assembly factor-like uncharacterized protein
MLHGTKKGDEMNKVLACIIFLPLLLVAAEWQSLNGPPAGRADDMSMGWDDNYEYWVIYAADQTHKLYKSTNDGEYWQVPTSQTEVDSPTCVITRPDVADTVYIGKDDDTPVWWSEDGGVNWAARSGDEQQGTNITNTQPLCFAMDPDYPDTIILGCAQDDNHPEMFITDDGGENWDALTGFPDVSVNEIGIRPSDPRGQELVAASNDGLYYTSNGGTSWTLKLDKSNMTSVSYGSKANVYAGSNSESEGFFKSTDGGVTWSSNPIGSFSYVRAVAAAGANDVYIAAKTSGNGHGIYHTTDGGTNWTYYGRDKGLFCNDKIKRIAIHPNYATNELVFSAGDWAVYRLDGPNSDWQVIVAGFKVIQSDNILNKSHNDIK